MLVIHLVLATASAAGPPALGPGCDCQDTDYTNTAERQVDLTGANLAGTTWAGRVIPSRQLQGASLKQAVLNGASFSGANLRDVDLTSANLEGSRLSTADLRGATLAGMNAKNATLKNSDLRGLDFDGVHLEGATFIDVDLRDADLSGAALKGAKFVRCSLIGASLPVLGEDVAFEDTVFDDATRWTGTAPAEILWARPGATWRGVRLTGKLDLSAIQMDGATFEAVEIHADLHGASFRGANFTRVRLGGDLSGTDFTGATATADPMWTPEECSEGARSRAVVFDPGAETFQAVCNTRYSACQDLLLAARSCWNMRALDLTTANTLRTRGLDGPGMAEAALDR